MRDLNGFSLILAKDGPKFHESAADADTSGNGSYPREGRRIYDAVLTSMDALAGSLAYSYLDFRPVVNATGLTGRYDIHLEATPEAQIGNDPNAETLTIFTAVREQLGLRLEPRKVPTEMFVVDAVHKPSVD